MKMHKSQNKFNKGGHSPDKILNLLASIEWLLLIALYVFVRAN